MANIFEDDSETQRPWYSKPLNWVRIFYLLLIVGLVVVGIVLNTQIWQLLIFYLDWLSSNMVLGSLAYILIHTFWVASALPGTYLTLGAGFIYAHLFSFWEGIAIATILSLLGSYFGSILAFLNGRYVLRHCISNLFSHSNKWIIIEHMAEQHGIKFCLLLRFTFLPASVVNYGTSVTKLKFIHYCISGIAFIPDIFIHSFAGAELVRIKDLWKGTLSTQDLPLFIGSMIVMGICLLLVGLLIYYAKKQVEKMTKEQERIDNQLNGTSVNEDDDDNNNICIEQNEFDVIEDDNGIKLVRRDSVLDITDVTPFGVKRSYKEVTERVPLL